MGNPFEGVKSPDDSLGNADKIFESIPVTEQEVREALNTLGFENVEARTLWDRYVSQCFVEAQAETNSTNANVLERCQHEKLLKFISTTKYYDPTKKNFKEYITVINGAAKTPEVTKSVNDLGDENWHEMHPDEINQQKELKDCTPEIVEFETMIAAFETSHSVPDLYAITEISFDSFAEMAVREAAKKDLIPIYNKLNAMQEETDITDEKYTELQSKYKYLARAIGIGNAGKVDHTR